MNVRHGRVYFSKDGSGGFLRKANGKIETFNAPPGKKEIGGTGSVRQLNSTGTIVGEYNQPASYRYAITRAFMRKPEGSIITIDIPGSCLDYVYCEGSVAIDRQARAKPLLDQFHRWLEQKLATLSAKSDTTAAIRYELSRCRALTRYVDDGLIEIDNSGAERALRAVALGRRNYLFAGADSGGHRAANIYCLVGSAKLNGGSGAHLAHRTHTNRGTSRQPHGRTAALEHSNRHSSCIVVSTSRCGQQHRFISLVATVQSGKLNRHLPVERPSSPALLLGLQPR